MILLQTSPCDQWDCQNGAQCLMEAGEAVCRCLPGFYGSKCEKMTTVHFLGRDGFLELAGAKLRPTAHISFQVCSHFHAALFHLIYRGTSCIEFNGFNQVSLQPNNRSLSTSSSP